jgi:hypothetical protein
MKTSGLFSEGFDVFLVQNLRSHHDSNDIDLIPENCKLRYGRFNKGN